jgi:integrase
MTLDELFQIYCEKRLRGCSQRTITLYKHSIEAFTKTVGHPATTTDLNDDNLYKHMHERVESGLSRATANKDHAQITAIWRWANKSRYVDTWPNVRKMAEPERVPLGWTPDELARIFASITAHPGRVCGVPASLWWKCLLLVLIDTGERIGPMRKLKRECLNGEYLLISAELRKKGTRDKLYKLSSETLKSLAELLSLHKEPVILPWDRSETYIYYSYDIILRRAMLSHDARSKFHRVRRAVASAVKSLGGDPTVALDHASPRTTRRYLDPRIVKDTPTSDYMDRYRKGG